MFTAFERLVAFRYLRARRQEGFISIIAWLSLIGITLGVATLIIVMAVMNGFREELFTRVLGLNGHINISAIEGNLADFDIVADTVRAKAEVSGVIPIIEGQVMASANHIASGAIVRAFRGTDFSGKELLSNNLNKGSLEDYHHNMGVFLGSRLARRMSLSVGDYVTLISPSGNPSAFGTVPRMKAYLVIGIVEIGMFEYDNNFIYMPLLMAQKFFRLEGMVTSLEVLLFDGENAGRIRAMLSEELAPYGYVRDWQQIHSSFFTALQVERNVMFLILTLIIVIAAFNIVSSQIMLVNDKGKGIAVLRTLGASKGMILRIFLITGASVGIVGTLAGSVIGISFAMNIESVRRLIQTLTDVDLFQAEIYFLSQLPAKINNMEVSLVIGMALGLSFIASIYPAWRAARLDPVELLRYE